MTDTKTSFRIGAYRPIYLWAGPGTIRMNRLKFMDQPVEEAVHHEAHKAEGAHKTVNELYCNWVHLMYDWGFPPEIESEDWQSFEQAAEVYHQAGSPVFAYIQFSNCTFRGSYQEKDWYARDTRGRKIYYYTGRYMTCLQNPDWQAHLKEMVTGAIRSGADGIFFDNLWHGEQPLSLWNAWLGGAGCSCRLCQEAYRTVSGEEIPGYIQPGEGRSDRYIRWRAEQLSRIFTEMAAYARSLKPGVVVSANDYDPVTRASYLVFGIDFPGLAQAQDLMMIENFGLPRWDVRPRPRLANNALTVRMVKPQIGENKHLSMLSYDVGIGFDGVYPARRYRQGMAEAAACGCSTTIKGTEYYQNGAHTLLTGDDFGEERAVIGEFNRWLETNQDFFLNPACNIAPIGLVHPGDGLWQGWHQLAPILFGAAQTLTAAGIPWRVIREPAQARGLQAVLVFQDADRAGYSWPAGSKVVHVNQLKDWQPEGASLTARWRFLNRVVSAGAHWLVDQYHGSRIGRRLMDRLGMARLVTQTPFFYLPPEEKQATLLESLPEVYPRVRSTAPVLIETWQRGESVQIHLVNYGAAAQKIRLELLNPVHAEVRSPDPAIDGNSVEGSQIELDLDVYAFFSIKTGLARPA